MSYICDVCGPRLDCNSIFCDNCKLGVIYEIKTNDLEILREASGVRTRQDAQKPSILHQIAPSEAEQRVGAANYI